jgi:hypothetical protein
MPVKRVRATSIKKATSKAKHAIPKGKHVKNVNMIDKTKSRKLKTYSVTYGRKRRVAHHKRAKLDLSLKGKSFGASWEPGDRKRHHHHHHHRK